MRTNAARKNVVVFRQIPDDLLERIRAWHDVVVADPRRAEELPRFREALHDADGLIGSSFKLGAEELARAPRLKVISSISVGVDNYDLDCLKERGITLCHTPGVLTETTADTVFALVIATSRRLVELSNHVRDGRWTRNVGEDLFGWDVHGKTLGVLGFGRIGQAVARRAALGFDMPVVFHDPFDVQVPASLAGCAVRASFDEVLARADIVALTLPLSDETRGLMDAQGVLDDEARRDLRQRLARGDRARGRAVAALDSGHLRAAGLDVFAVEPLPQDSPLRTHPKVTPFPHIGSATHETRRAMAELATENLLRVLDGETAVAAFDLSKV